MLINKAIELTSKKTEDIVALEIGPGVNPEIDKFSFKKHCYLDKETTINKSNFLKGDICNQTLDEKFDLIYESLCWHENTGAEWEKFLFSIFNHLKPEGLFISRHAIFNKKMEFNETNHFFNQKTNELYCLKKERPVRYIPNSIEIEETTSRIGLDIIYLMAPLNKKVIIDRKDANPRQTDPDLLELICIKNI